MGSFSSHHEYTFYPSPSCKIDLDANDPRSPYPNRTPLTKTEKLIIIPEQSLIDERDPRSPKINRTPFESLSLKEKEEEPIIATPLTKESEDGFVRKIEELQQFPVPLLLESPPVFTPVTSLRKRKNTDKFQTVTPRSSRRNKVIIINDKENKKNGTTAVIKQRREPFSPLTDNSPRNSPSKLAIQTPSPVTKKRRQIDTRSDAEIIFGSGEFL